MAVDVFDGLIRRVGHVHREELTLDAIGHIVHTTAGVVHAGDELQVVDCLEVTALFSVEEVQTLVVNELTSDFESLLVTPLVDFRH